jgi:hypothetical protein
MAKTLFDLTLELARILGTVREGVATGGSTTTIVDTVARTEDDDAFNGGTAWITYDAGGAGAAPQGEYQIVSDFTASSDTITTAAFSAAIASGDRYAVAGLRYPLDLLIQKINESFGVIEKTDTSTACLPMYWNSSRCLLQPKPTTQMIIAGNLSMTGTHKRAPQAQPTKLSSRTSTPQIQMSRSFTPPIIPFCVLPQTN